MQLFNLLRPNAPAARAGIIIAWDVAPIHQLQSTLTVPQPRSLPVPKSQSRRNRISLAGVMALTSMAIPPSLSAKSDGHKWKEAHTEDTHEINSTLPITSSRFDGFCSLTGSHSAATKLHPPSITLTPLGLGTPQQWRSTSKESRHSLALLYTSPGFNLPGQLVAGLSNLMPNVPSLTGSYQVSSTWPASVFTPGPSSPHLTIN